MAAYNFSGAVQAIWQLVGAIDQYIAEAKPWKLAESSDPGRQKDSLAQCFGRLDRRCDLWPFWRIRLFRNRRSNYGSGWVSPGA